MGACSDGGLSILCADGEPMPFPCQGEGGREGGELLVMDGN